MKKEKPSGLSEIKRHYEKIHTPTPIERGLYPFNLKILSKVKTCMFFCLDAK